MSTAVLLAAYNPDEKFWREQIASLKAQTFSEWICVISDDSTSTAKQEFIQNSIAGDSRFEYHRNNGARGIVGNFENALKIALKSSPYEFFALCDQDDVWEPNKLQVCVDYLKTHSQTLMVHHDLALVDAELKPIAESCWQYEGRDNLEGASLVDLCLRNQVTGCSAVFRRQLAEQALPFLRGENIDILHDQWLAALASAQKALTAIHQPLMKYRQHGGNAVGAQQQKSVLADSSQRSGLKTKAQRVAKSTQALAHALLLKFPQNSKVAQLRFLVAANYLSAIKTAPYLIRGKYWRRGLLYMLGSAR